MNQREPSWEQAVAHASELQADIRKAHEAGKHKRAAYLQQRCLQWSSARVVATRTAFNKMKPWERPPANTLPGIAGTLHAWQGTDEPVLIYWKPKQSNSHEFRPVMQFGIRNRALQYLAVAALQPRTDFDPRQYAMRGQGGLNAAVARVAEQMAAGHNHVAELDIQNFYPTIDGTKLTEFLPLPQEVTQRVILSRNLNLYPGNKCYNHSQIDLKQINSLPNDDLINVSFGCDASLQAMPVLVEEIAEARQGIPQGSSASSVVSELLLAPVLRQSPGSGITNYADNMLVTSQTAEGVSSILKVLRSALKAHLVGPLVPKTHKFYQPGQAVQFLGYSLSMKGGQCCIEPSSQNLQKFKTAFSHKRKQAEAAGISKATRWNRISELHRYVHSWSSAFRIWPGAAQHRETYLGELAKLAKST